MPKDETKIKDRLNDESLRIDPPPMEDSIGSSYIDIRLGRLAIEVRSRDARQNDFFNFEKNLLHKNFKDSFKLNLGEELCIDPGSHWLCTSLEYVSLSQNLIGFISGISALSRAGIILETAKIDPGFCGKFAILASNLGEVPHNLISGQRIARLTISSFSKDETSENLVDLLPSERQLTSIKDHFHTKKSNDIRIDARESINLLLNKILVLKGIPKGKALEELTAQIFSNVTGLRIIKRNARLAAEEIDIIIRNELKSGFWQVAGSTIIIECKCWNEKVGSREISILLDKMQTISSDVKAGILVAFSGISGSAKNDAMLKVREARQRGRYIIVIDAEDLYLIASGVPLSDIIEHKYDELILL